METLLPTLAQLGTAVFAASGALAGLRNRLDVVGVAFVATLTGIGGGTVRDLLLGAVPLSWVAAPTEIYICLAVALAVCLANQALSGRRLRALLVADAAGLALFAVLGAERGLSAGAHPFVAMLLGAMTASFGGLIRDVICNETPVFLQREIYITAALAGAGLFLLMPESLGFEWRAVMGIALAFGLRLLAIVYNWSLPFPQYRD